MPKNDREGGALCDICHQIFKEAKNQRRTIGNLNFFVKGTLPKGLEGVIFMIIEAYSASIIIKNNSSRKLENNIIIKNNSPRTLEKNWNHSPLTN